MDYNVDYSVYPDQEKRRSWAGGGLKKRGPSMSIAKVIFVASALAVSSLLFIQQRDPAHGQGTSPQPDLAAVKRDYRRPPPRPIENRNLDDLGGDLFFDPRISASGKTACASCHFPELGWAVPHARSRNDSAN